MLTLVYDAIDGQAFPDGQVDTYVEAIVKEIGIGVEVPITFSTDNILNGIRVAIKQGRIPLDQVRLVCYRVISGEIVDRELRIYESGGITPWPDGFCDTNYTYLMKLL